MPVLLNAQRIARRDRLKLLSMKEGGFFLPRAWDFPEFPIQFRGRHCVIGLNNPTVAGKSPGHAPASAKIETLVGGETSTKFIVVARCRNRGWDSGRI